MTKRTAVAELSGATKKYGSIEALRGVDLNVEPGQLVALLGGALPRTPRELRSCDPL